MDSEEIIEAVSDAVDSLETRMDQLERAIPQAIADGLTRVTFPTDITRLLELMSDTLDALLQEVRGRE